jgi:hypothetical protein
MSLFESASLVVTPNGTKASKLYAIKPTDGSGDLTVTRATSATRVNANGVIETVASNVPRIDYSGGGCPSILVEGQRTNLVLYSQQFDNAYWGQFLCTITANDAISPDGTQNADKIVSTLANSNNVVFRNNITGISGGSQTISFFAKAGTSSTARLQIFDLTNVFSSEYNLTNGTTANTTAGATATIKLYGNGWYSCTLTATTLAANHFFDFGIKSTAVGQFAYIYGAQFESLANYATSYIPTTTASVTRNADVISKTGISSLIGQTEGTLYTEIKVNKLIGAASRYIFHLSDGTANNRIYIAFSGAASNVLRARIFNGGTLQCSINSSALTSTGTYKLAMAYKNNDIVFYVNGVQIGTDTSATIPTCSRVDIGQNYNNVAQLSDNILLSTLWKTRLTNAELAELTTI